jgi:hypothetical protein
MGCCAGCEKPTGERTEFDVDIHFTSAAMVMAELIGNNVDFVSGTLLTKEGAMPKGGFTVQYSSYGERKHVNIYRNRLPFDELISTIQFNTTTGEIRIQNLARIEFEKVRLTLTKDHMEKPLYLELGDGVYRVPNLSAGIQLSGHLDIYDYTLTQLQIALNKVTDWPRLVLHHNRDLCVVFNPEHPTWKNDALWQ